MKRWLVGRLNLVLVGSVAHAAAEAPARDGEGCEAAATGRQTVVDELVRMFVYIQIMDDRRDKALALIDYKQKLQKMQNFYGVEILAQVIEKVGSNRLLGELLVANQDAKHRADQVRREAFEDLLFLQRHEPHELTGAALRSVYFDNESLIVPFNGKLKRYHLEKKEIVETYRLATERTDRVVLTADRKYAYVGGVTLARVDLADPTAQPVFYPLPEGLVADGVMALSKDGRWLVVSGAGSDLAIYDTTDTSQWKFSDNRDVNDVTSIHFSDSGKYMLANVAAGYQFLVNLETFKEVSGVRGSVWTDAAFIPGQDQILLLHSSDESLPKNILAIYDIEKHEHKVLPGFEWHAAHLYIAPHGRTVLMSSREMTDGGEFALYSLELQREIPLSGPAGWDGSSIAAMSRDRNQLFFTSRQHDNSEAFYYDFANDEFRTLKLKTSLWDNVNWHLPTGEFSPDGKSLILNSSSRHDNLVMQIW